MEIMRQFFCVYDNVILWYVQSLLFLYIFIFRGKYLNIFSFYWFMIHDSWFITACGKGIVVFFYGNFFDFLMQWELKWLSLFTSTFSVKRESQGWSLTVNCLLKFSLFLNISISSRKSNIYNRPQFSHNQWDVHARNFPFSHPFHDEATRDREKKFIYSMQKYS